MNTFLQLINVLGVIWFAVYSIVQSSRTEKFWEGGIRHPKLDNYYIDLVVRLLEKNSLLSSKELNGNTNSTLSQKFTFLQRALSTIIEGHFSDSNWQEMLRRNATWKKCLLGDNNKLHNNEEQKSSGWSGLFYRWICMWNPHSMAKRKMKKKKKAFMRVSDWRCPNITICVAVSSTLGISYF